LKPTCSELNPSEIRNPTSEILLDNLTHSLVGLALSRAGLNRLTTQATAVLLLAANAPDIDVLSAAGGSLTYLRYHRHLTHSLLMAPVMALLPVLVVRLVTRKPIAWAMAYLVSLVGLASHLALDLTNSYGVRLLLPFSARWLRLDLNSIVDPWIWTALLLSVIAPALSRLVAGEIGAPTRPGRMAPLLALAFVLLYDGARVVIHQRALAILDSRIYLGSAPLGVAAFPDTFNPFAWRGLVEGSRFYALFDLNVGKPFDPTTGPFFYRAEDSAAVRRAAETEPFKVFAAFAQYPIWTVTPLSDPPNGSRVQLSDMRFGTPRRGGFRTIAILDSQLRVVSSRFSFTSQASARGD
jgi:inner membrane protein